MPSNHLILCCPLLLPSVFSSIRAFSNELALCIRWPKYWSFSFSISPSKEYSGWISLRIDWFGLFAVQGTPKCLLDSCFKSKFENISYSALILLYDATVTSVHDYWKNHSFDCMDFIGKVMSLLLNTLSRFVIAFLPKSKGLLISWLQSPSAVILEPKKIKSVTVESVTFCHQSEWPSSKFVQTVNTGEHTEKRELSCTVGGNTN